MSDGFFSDLANTKPFVKLAFEGFAGTGKTYTAAQIAAGIHKRIGSTKPIVVFDTERAAKFLKGFFADEKIAVLHKESRSLADLTETLQRCADGAADVLLIDSISHVWENFLEAYSRKVKRTRLEFQDWGIIKPTWKREFSEPFVNQPVHVLMTGRAGYEYETEKNAETGKREIFKSGIKMKVEGETAYEPDLLFLMERFEEVLDTDKRVWREATCLKDRSTLIDGKTFKNPTYADVAPAIERILLDPASRTERPAEQDAADLIKTEEEQSQRKREREIQLEEIQGYLVSIWPGQSAEEKRHKGEAIYEALGTRSWRAVEGMPLSKLREGMTLVREYVAKVKAATAAAE